jgi:hypothetical protein
MAEQVAEVFPPEEPTAEIVPLFPDGISPLTPQDIGELTLDQAVTYFRERRDESRRIAATLATLSARHRERIDEVMLLRARLDAAAAAEGREIGPIMEMLLAERSEPMPPHLLGEPERQL